MLCMLRYKFVYGRDSWIKSLFLMLPLQCGLLEGIEHRQTPMALSFLSSFSRHCPNQFEKAAAAVLCLTWGQSSSSQCYFGLISKNFPLLPAGKAVPLLDTGALASTTDKVWLVAERWLEASWHRKAISVFILGEPSKSKKQLLMAQQQTKHKRSLTCEGGKKKNELKRSTWT